jgi:hypothetical protein
MPSPLVSLAAPVLEAKARVVAFGWAMHGGTAGAFLLEGPGQAERSDNARRRLGA